MSRYLPLLLCLACQTADPVGAGLIGAPGPQGPPGEKGDKGDPAPLAKQLHLIVADTGDDLGLLVSFPGMAYNERVGAVVAYTSQAPILYQQDECKGQGMMFYGLPAQMGAVTGPGGTLLRSMARATVMAFRSAQDPGGCKNTNGQLLTAPYMDTGIMSRKYAESDLAVELR